MFSRTKQKDAGQAVPLTLYKWAGKWGPFQVKVPCGECTLSTDVIEDTLARELADIQVNFVVKDWLSNWWEPLFSNGGWHAPIILVGNQRISQGDALNRGVLVEAVIREYVTRVAISGTHVFGKEKCRHCDQAKVALTAAGIHYTYHDVVKSPRALYEMLTRVKPLIGATTPVTTPQIWIKGTFIGGMDALTRYLDTSAGATPRITQTQ